MLLILTSELDLAADFLIVELLERGLPYFRLNTEELHRRHCSVRFSDAASSTHIVADAGPGLDFNQVHAIWYRRALHGASSAALPPEQRHFVEGELRHFWAGMVMSPGRLWVNPIDRVAAAEHKLWQLQIAREIGLHIPATLVSRDPVELRTFVGEVGKAICKPIFHGLLIEGDARYSAYTRRVCADSFDERASIDLCPVLLQAEIPRVADLRITIVGNECFVARIKSSDANMVDWRKPGADLQYETGFLPEEVKEKCQQMLQKLGLVYGAFDFIERPDGNLVFLEVNPTGEWAWLEETLGFRVRQAFIRLFFGSRN